MAKYKKPPHPYPPGSFGHYLQQHGVAGPHKLPIETRALARALSGAKALKIAPNSPVIPRLAKALDVPLAEIQAFAKGPPLTERWLRKIQSQMENNTIPRGTKLRKAMRSAAKHRAGDDDHGTLLGEVVVEGRRDVHPSDRENTKVSATRPGAGGPAPVSGSFARFVKKHGGGRFASLAELAKVAKVRTGVVWLLNTSGKVARDSPNLDRLAQTLGVPVKAVARFAQGQATHGTGYAKRAAQNLIIEDHRASGKAIVHVPKAETNGNGHGKVTRGSYNKLTRQETTLRQAARDMVTSLNITIMQGGKLTEPMPVAVLHAVLQDYLREKDPKATDMLVNPRFAEFFDPR